MCELGIQQRFQVTAQRVGAHHQGISTGDKDVGDVRVSAQILDEGGGVLRDEPRNVTADKLRPPEAVRAIRVAGLPGSGEEEHRLRILVLQPRKHIAMQPGRVQFDLSAGMRVEFATDRRDDPRYLSPVGVSGEQLTHLLKLLSRQHFSLWEIQLEDRVVGDGVPVDQLLAHIAVRPEREHVPDDAHGVNLVRMQTVNPGDRPEIAQGVGPQHGW